ncbi:hypothetical protein CS369_08375 [Candidatus Symbiopectobacterium sp. 'North America']|nr:hypothetical protein [Candidatus Symbiopectobacterium sp. 'North America']
MSPPGKKGMQSPANIADTVEVIAELFVKEKIGFMALCEVNNESFESLSNALSSLPFYHNTWTTKHQREASLILAISMIRTKLQLSMVVRISVT